MGVLVFQEFAACDAKQSWYECICNTVEFYNPYIMETNKNRRNYKVTVKKEGKEGRVCVCVCYELIIRRKRLDESHR